MTRKSIVAREKKREKLSDKYYPQIKALKEEARRPDTSMERRIEIQMQLQRFKKDAHVARRRKRCLLTGRPRGVLKKFMICRHKLRELASAGVIPGIMKGSW